MRQLQRWDEQFSSEETNEILKELALWHAEQITDVTERERLTACITRGDYRFLCDYDLAYANLSTANAIHLRQALGYFSKREDLDLGIDREAVAYEKFRQSEDLCLRTNHIFRSWQAGKFQFLPAVEAVFHGAQRKIASILGSVPSADDLKVQFGPGATTQVKKMNASARSKLSAAFACSENLIPCLSEALENLPGWIPFGDADSAQVAVHVHDGKLAFVPKNAKTYRAIVVEPSLNTMYQGGIGRYMSRRLRRFGVDITDQSKNQRLARVGSLTGALATLDLSSASDTISTGVVEHLLPPEWFEVLSRLRTGVVVYNGSQIRLQKFSSMGNGFTFPLETLIFYALALASCEVAGAARDSESVSAYGDDLIVPVEAVPLFTQVLHSAGFIVNEEKSFSSGPFRESCGADYLKGIDIRPCYIKNRLSGDSIFVLHNFFVRNFYEDAPINLLLSLLSPSLRIYGPDGYGDGHLLGSWQPKPARREPERPFPEPDSEGFRKDWKNPKYSGGWGGYFFDTFTFKARKSFRPTAGDCIIPIYSIYVSGPRPGLPGLDIKHPTGVIDDVPHHDSGVGPYRYDSKGRLGCVLPGTKGYKRISIYTLSSGD